MKAKKITRRIEALIMTILLLFSSMDLPVLAGGNEGSAVDEESIGDEESIDVDENSDAEGGVGDEEGVDAEECVGAEGSVDEESAGAEGNIGDDEDIDAEESAGAGEGVGDDIDIEENGGNAEGAAVRRIRSAKIEWLTPDSPSDGQAYRLFLRKHGSDSEVSMQFRIEAVLTGLEAHEPGSVRILFPRQIWHQRSTYYAGGEVMSAGYGGMSFSVPDAPSESSAWHWEEAENGQYAIVNDAAIDAAAEISFQCTITGIDVTKIVDMRPSDPLKATVEVMIDGVTDSMSTQELTAVIDTREQLSDPGVGLSGQLYSTPENVPAAMLENLDGGKDAANNYVYVRWTTWPLYEGSQYFSLDLDLWAGVAEENGVSIPGIILGEGGGVSGGAVGIEDTGDQAGEHYSRQTLRCGYDNSGNRDSRATEIWTAYPMAQMQDNKTYTIRAASQWTLTEADPERDGDPREVSRAGATASVNYTHSGWAFPAGQFGVYMYSGSQPGHTHDTHVKDSQDESTSPRGHKKDCTYEMAVGALRNGRSVTLDYEVLTVGYGYSYTAGPTSEVPDLLPEGWEQDPAHYLNWTYRMETTDDTVSVANINPNGNLGAGDYRFDSITIAAPEMFSYGRQTQDMYQLPGSEFGYRPDSSLPKPEVEVWIEKNKSGSWELYDTVSVRSGTKMVSFPADDNVTGYRTVIATNQAACKLAVWPKVTILPSEHVLQLAEEGLQDYTNVVLMNEARQVTTLYCTAERQDEVLPEQSAWLEANDDYTTESIDSSLSTLTVAGYKVYGSMLSTGDYSYSRASNDPAKRRVVVTLYAAVYEQSNLTDEDKYNEAVAMGAITPETSGTWYLLLPEHFEPNTSTIQMRSGDRVTDVQVTENFRNSGRTLVTVKATLTPAPHKLSSYNSHANNCYGDKPQISMDMYVPWSEYNKVRDGYAVYHAAFESGKPGRLGNLTDQNYYQSVGYPDVWPGTPNTYLYSISDSQIRGWMSDLDPDSDEERFVYLRVSESIRNVQDITEQQELKADARADLSGSWGKGSRDENQVTVTEGGKYTYRLTVASKQDGGTGGILIYDALEEYAPPEGSNDADDMNSRKAWSGDWQGKGRWNGRLTSVDLSELTRNGCVPKLYYSTNPGLVFDNNIDTSQSAYADFNNTAWSGAYKLTDTSIWTEVTGSLHEGKWTVPVDLHVTAIAVDAQHGNNGQAYVLAKEKKLSVYLHMTAPDDGGDDSKWAAKGAYDHKRDNASSTDDIDWIGAGDPANNMYAYNEATALFIPYSSPTTEHPDGLAQTRTRQNGAYTRVGIVPGVISVRQTWKDGERVNGQYMEDRDGLRPDSVTVHLKGRTGVQGSPEIEQELTLNEDNGWKGVFQNAPDTDSDGNAYTYTVTEDPVPGYTTAVYREIGRSYEIVGTHEKETITIRGKLLWLNPDGTPAEAPVDSVSLSLKRINEQGAEEQIPFNDGIKVTQPSKGNLWNYTFSGYDRYAPGGYEYRYVLCERNVPDGWFSQNDTAPMGVTVTAQ